jgi:chromosomal replication initiation ATPase DnaA
MIQEILQQVSIDSEVSIDKIISHSRKQDALNARYVVCKLAYEFGKVSLKKIGDILNGRDHSTIHNAIDNVNDCIINKNYNVQLYDLYRKSLISCNEIIQKKNNPPKKVSVKINK